MNRRSLIIFLLAAILVLPGAISAQDLSGGGLVLTPSIYSPKPGQQVTITLKSFSMDVNAASVTWTAGGKTIASGIGATTATVDAPKLGGKLIVNVTATSPDGTSLSSSMTVNSGSVDMIIESDGYVHSFFRGKLAPVYQNTVKVIAVPHLANSAGKEYDPKTLVYNWQQESKVLQSQSGYGKQSVTIPGAIVPRPYLLTVDISTRDGSVRGSGAILVEATSPSVSFYRNDALYGPLFNNAVGSTLFLGTQRESGVIAVPYGFNGSAANPFSYEWHINGVARNELSGKQSAILRSPASTAGSSNVELVVRSAQSILQQATGAFSVVWSASSGTTASPTTSF